MNSGLIDYTGKDTPDQLYITDLGKETLEVFENDLPYSVRRKNQSALLRLMADIERQSLVKSRVEEREKGFEAVCTLLDGEDTLLEYKLYVPTRIQAQMVVDQFERDPIDKYKKILSQLIDENVYGDE